MALPDNGFVMESDCRVARTTVDTGEYSNVDTVLSSGSLRKVLAKLAVYIVIRQKPCMTRMPATWVSAVALSPLRSGGSWSSAAPWPSTATRCTCTPVLLHEIEFSGGCGRRRRERMGK